MPPRDNRRTVQPLRHRSFTERHPYFIPRLIALIVLIAVIAIVAFGVRALVGALTGPSTEGNLEQSAEGTRTDTPAAEADDLILTLGGSAETTVLRGEEFLDGGCHAVQRDTGDVSSTITTQSNVDTNTPGDYLVTYTATDSAGAQASKTRTVHVVDTLDKQKTGIPVLMYHYIYTASDVPKMDEDSKDNYLLDTEFEKQLEYLIDEKFYFPSYEEVNAFIRGEHSLPKNSIVLTFDDGQKGFLKYGIPLLEKYRIPATSFIIGSKDNSKKNIIEYASEYISFQSHSYDMHRDGLASGDRGIMGSMSESEITADLKKAQDVLGTTQAFAYPYGYYTDEGEKAATDAGIECSFIIYNDWARIGDPATALPRVRISSGMSLEAYEYICTHTVQ